MEGLSVEERRKLRAEKYGINVEEQQQELRNQSQNLSKVRLNNETRLIDDRPTMSVEDLENEIKRLQDRQQKFGGDVTDEAQKRLEKLQRRLDFARHKEAPQPILSESEISPDTLYLYGVDYMSTDDIQSYIGDQFGGESGVQITWINDSSCRIKFENEQLAQRAYQLSSMSSNTDQRTKLIIGEAMVDVQTEGVDPRNFDVNVGWKEAFGFQLKTNGRMQKLWMRFATDKDFKSENTKGENSRYYTIQKQRRDYKMKQYGYKDKRGGRDNKGGPDNSNFIKKAISKGDKFQGNLREKLRANQGDDWIGGIEKPEQSVNAGDAQENMEMAQQEQPAEKLQE
eukprot:403374902